MSMYNLIEYSWNYSDTISSLWFYPKDQAKLLGKTVAQSNRNQANGILENAEVAVPLKYLSNFWRSL